MLEQMMTVAEWADFEERTRKRSNLPHQSADWSDTDIAYLKTIMVIDSTCLTADKIHVHPNGQVWIELQDPDRLTTDDRTSLFNLLADTDADGAYILDGSRARIALSPNRLLQKRRLATGYRVTSGGRLHETHLQETAALLGDPDIMETSFPRYYLFRRHLSLCLSGFKSRFKEPDPWAAHSSIDGLDLPEIDDTVHPLRKEYGKRARDRVIFRLKVETANFSKVTLDDRIKHALQTITNPYWWTAQDLEMTAQQIMRSNHLLRASGGVIELPPRF